MKPRLAIVPTEADSAPMIQIAEDLAFPLDAVTQSFAILAKRGAGKTYTASVLAEEFVAAGLPFVVIDPTGAWWGLRAAADGERPGLPVVIVGGGHGDVALEATAGKVLADLVVESPGWYVFDLSDTKSNAEQDRFVADFAEAIYRRKANTREPLHLIFDEADSFAPQRPMPGQQRMLGAMEALVRRGRVRGIGVTLVTQRAAVLNKNVLTQTEALILLQTTSPQDRAAVDAWVAGNASKEERDEVMGSLASLDRGEAWFWSPSWMRTLKRIHVRERRTFNSSATPEAGGAIDSVQLASVDLELLTQRLAATIEKARQDDPAQLRKRIVELEGELSEVRKAQPETRIERVEVPVITDEEFEQISSVTAAFRGTLNGLIEGEDRIIGLLDTIDSRVGLLRNQSMPAAANPKVADFEQAFERRARTEPKPAAAPVEQPGAMPALGKAERSILSVLAQFPSGRSKTQLALQTGYSGSGGGFNNAISSLRSKGLIEGTKDNLCLRSGVSVEVEPLPIGDALLRFWIGQLPKAAGLILDVLAIEWPAGFSKVELAAKTGYEASGGGFNNALSRLRTLELIERGDPIRASGDLMRAVRS